MLTEAHVIRVFWRIIHQQFARPFLRILVELPLLVLKNFLCRKDPPAVLPRLQIVLGQLKTDSQAAEDLPMGFVG